MKMVAPARVNRRPSNLAGLPKQAAQWRSKTLVMSCSLETSRCAADSMVPSSCESVRKNVPCLRGEYKQ